MKYFDINTRGFYEENTDGRIEISDEKWQELLNKQSIGGKIQIVNDNVYCLFNNEQVLNGVISLNPNYDAQQAEKRETYFKANFFETSLGWIRKKVSMKDGSTKDFLFDCFPLLQTRVSSGTMPANSFLYYGLPDFANDLTTDYMLTLQHINSALSTAETATFISECSAQIIKEFWG